jgi:hypothetical protein
MRRVSAIFDHLHEYVQGNVLRDFMVELREGTEAEFPKKRNMAYCLQRRDGSLCIVVAPKMENARTDQIDGVLRHEFGHALYMFCGRQEHTEREADQLAEEMFGAPIYYDRDLIQSTRTGKRPRPAHLG